MWNLNQLGGCFSMVADKDPLVKALEGFSDAYRRALSSAMVRRLGLKPRGEQENIGLANAAFRVLGEGGDRLRWEPFFFDWFGGAASEDRAMGGARAPLYAGAAMAELRGWFGLFEADRPERLDADYFKQAEPTELLYPDIEALWTAISERDDWGPFEQTIHRIRTARENYGLAQPALVADSDNSDI